MGLWYYSPFLSFKILFFYGIEWVQAWVISWATNGFELFHVFFSLWYGPFKGVGSGIQLHIRHWGQIFDKRLKPLKHETLDTHPHNVVTFYESSSHKPLVLGNDGVVRIKTGGKDRNIGGRKRERKSKYWETFEMKFHPPLGSLSSFHFFYLYGSYGFLYLGRSEPLHIPPPQNSSWHVFTFCTLKWRGWWHGEIFLPTIFPKMPCPPTSLFISIDLFFNK